MFAAVPAAHAAEDADGLILAASGVRMSAPRQGEEAEGSGLVDDEIPLRLRSERRFNVLGRKKAPLVAEIGIPYPVDLKKGDAYPLFLVADQVDGRTDEVAVATGEVELRKIDSRVYGDKMTYWPLDDEIDATGNVRMLQDGMEVNAPRVRMKMSEQIGFAEQPDYVFVKEVASKFYRPTVIPVTAATSNVTTSGAPMMVNVPNSYGLPTTAPPTRPSIASGTAERAEFEGENQVTLFDTTYSTCKPGDRDWYVRATEMHLDYDRNVGDAKNASLWFKDVPLFYSPVATFPLNNKPRSGFLHPFFATSTRDGLDITTPYYWNIAPNYDATLYPRYMSKRGLQLGAEARYLDFNYSGHVAGGVHTLRPVGGSRALCLYRSAPAEPRAGILGNAQLQPCLGQSVLAGYVVTPVADLAGAVAATVRARLHTASRAADQPAGPALPDPADRSAEPGGSAVFS